MYYKGNVNMKNSILLLSFRFRALLTFFILLSCSLSAQDGGLDIDIDVDKKEWYEQPWAWVVGAAVFILLLVAILRGGKTRR